jgi:hypothetical protein
MCFSKAPKVKPVASAPSVGPEVIDDTAINERDEARRKRRMQYGRQSTILAGNKGGGSPTGAAKGLLGA